MVQNYGKLNKYGIRGQHLALGQSLVRGPSFFENYLQAAASAAELQHSIFLCLDVWIYHFHEFSSIFINSH